MSYPRFPPCAGLRRLSWGAIAFALLLPLSAGGQPQELSPGATLPRPDATLQRVNGATTPVSGLLGSKGTVFVFWSNECPWVDRVEGRVQRLAQDVRPSGVQVVLVNANDASAAPTESLEASRKRADRQGYQMPYVRDPEATFARALGASRTPHAFFFDAQRRLVYVGAIDDSPSDPDRVEEPYLRSAITAVLNGETPEVATTKPFGCTLKYAR